MAREDASPTSAPDAAGGARLRVFVSYSRKDTAFADELVAGLEYDGGFEVFLDRHSISEGEEWEKRLGGLIAAADIVVFLLSKSSLASKLCNWEAEHARSLSKRIVPALIEPIDGMDVPPVLKALNYVRFDDGKSFMAGLTSLRRALRADLAWIREHTRLLTRAQEWDAAGRIENRLLSGPDITLAKAWVEKRPPDAPPPLELHHDYIAASEQAEGVRLSGERERAERLTAAVSRSRRALVIATGSAGVAVALGAVAGFQWMQSRAANAEYFKYTEKAEAAFKDYEAQIVSLEKSVVDLQAQLAAAPVAPPVVDPPPPQVTTPPAGEPPEATDPKVEELIAQTEQEIENLKAQIIAQSPDRIPVWNVVPDRSTFNRPVAYLRALEANRAELEMMLKRTQAIGRKVPVRPKAPDVYEKEQMIRQQNAPTGD